jgi:hypothetical protein
VNLVNRTPFHAPRASSAQQREVVAETGWELVERGPYYRHPNYPNHVFTLAAAYQVATADSLDASGLTLRLMQRQGTKASALERLEFSCTSRSSTSSALSG